MKRKKLKFWTVPLAAVACGVGFMTLAGLTAAQAQTRVADPGRPADTGFSVYFQYCAGCHDSAALSADKTVPVMRDLGEPRIARSLEDTPTAIHGDIGRRLTAERKALLVAFLSPDNDKSYDCGPPERRILTASPQCLALREAERAAAAVAAAASEPAQ